MAVLDAKIIDEFVEWFHSKDAEEWRVLVEAEGLDELFLASAGDVLKKTGATTILACQYNSKDLIQPEELYAMVDRDA